MSSAMHTAPPPRPIITTHPIMNEVARWVTANRSRLERASDDLNAGTQPMELVNDLHAEGRITQAQLDEIKAYWEPSGALHDICACFRDALQLLVDDSYRRLSAWLITGVVTAPTATVVQVGRQVHIMVMAPPLSGGTMAKLTRSSDPEFASELHALNSYLSYVLTADHG